ncbi:hypothetical protein K503DRAFT_774002 [Rhizopogon vinicolor AM-OR11-026]|uniref:Uncharacterized protein n=1 Tax=Rhizopogon vinicolor AM-OR11-026 TaxID=1314800 RepID=A0A1B7MQU2_9AGAM|nr:hypothetical protein K503DRAFT_774002 [Rhizopogon vinicolor AM-OR11-026]
MVCLTSYIVITNIVRRVKMKSNFMEMIGCGLFSHPGNFDLRTGARLITRAAAGSGMSPDGRV